MHFLAAIITVGLLTAANITLLPEKYWMAGFYSLYIISTIIAYITMKKRMFEPFITNFPTHPPRTLIAFMLAWPFAIVYYLAVWYGILFGTIERRPVKVKKKKRRK